MPATLDGETKALPKDLQTDEEEKSFCPTRFHLIRLWESQYNYDQTEETPKELNQSTLALSQSKTY